MYMRTLIAVSAMAVISTTAHAGCGIYGTVKLLANDFPATQAMSAAVRKCDGGSADISVNLNKDHKDLIVPAFTANPPEFTVSHKKSQLRHFGPRANFSHPPFCY